MTDTEHSGDQSSVQNSVSIQVQLHIAEYQALTTRATYFITLMGSVWPVLLIFFGLILQGQLWNILPPALLIWGSGVIIQISLFVWAQLLFEQYMIVRYTESELRRRVAAILGNSAFWEYEQFLTRQRGKVSTWWEFSICGGIMVAIGWTATFRWRVLGSKWDLIGIVANGLLAVIHIVRTVDIVRTRRGWERCEDHVIKVGH
jgi:hypothetical protein